MKSTLLVGILFVVDTGFKIFKNLFILFFVKKKKKEGRAKG
jgi:hypothetical protein